MPFLRISKATARKRFANGESITLCPCKLRPGFPFSPHSTLYPESIESWKERAQWYAPKTDDPNNEMWRGSINATAWDLMMNDWAFYNTSYEQGYYASYWVEN
jgi:hypothetical protein